jgi:WXG100 family type VII secretion target
MTTIHVNTDVMRQLGQRFMDWNNVIRDQLLPELRNLTGQLEGDWSGVSRQAYDQMLQGWEQTANNMMNQGEDLGNHVLNTANQFDQADRS